MPGMKMRTIAASITYKFLRPKQLKRPWRTATWQRASKLAVIIPAVGGATTSPRAKIRESTARASRRRGVSSLPRRQLPSNNHIELYQVQLPRLQMEGISADGVVFSHSELLRMNAGERALRYNKESCCVCA
ncbi:uncharacterized protein LOC133672562 [Populus nigra]|uniref:uncharacterized protein LOC133672562 n=1 Tax=Populus nigra TaxID=3691 RepID=UPI002B272339|nr:uncharacterized protein LOC133672562 [Populus nigra]